MVSIKSVWILVMVFSATVRMATDYQTKAYAVRCFHLWTFSITVLASELIVL